MDNPLELIRIIDKAISLEKNARKFYLRAAETVNSIAGKNILNWFADFENGHISRLNSRRKKIIEENSLENDVSPDSMSESTLSEASDNLEIRPDMSDTEIIMVGLSNEERAHDFYTRKASRMPDGQAKALFEALAIEERRHMDILIDQRKHLEIKRIWQNLDDVIRGE